MRPSAITIVQQGSPQVAGTWAASDWRVGRFGHTDLDPGQVRDNGTGVDLVLGPSTYAGVKGAEIKSTAVVSGDWTMEWRAQISPGTSGVVPAFFSYQEPYDGGWNERDVEFLLAGSTTRFAAVLHGEDASGRHVGANFNVELGFDAALAFHTYTIVQEGSRTHWLVDGEVAWSVDARDLGAVNWAGPVKSVAMQWEPAPDEYDWAGPYAPRSHTLTTRLSGASVSNRAEPGERPILGTAGADTLADRAGAGGHYLDGRAGNDALRGDDGADRLMGGVGNDALYGGRGEDILVGGDSNDRLEGGLGADVLWGDDVTADGAGQEGCDRFVWSAPADSAFGRRGDAVHGATGEDVLDLSGLDANDDRSGNQAFGWGVGKAYSAWLLDVGEDQLLRADVSGDGRPDFEARLVDGAVTRDDILV